ncbi:hypothetical protein ABT039_26475 [Streptomyces lasiicapitis]|uniref:hypothetical protein n=1 Tax=Streptomyces lasiicapitis TaxID=1923961 RepID=UPI003316EC58
MRRIRAGVGTLVLSAAAMLVSGCAGDGGQDDPAPRAPASSAPQTAPTNSKEAARQHAPGPEGDLDRLADRKGWEVSSGFTSASAYVADVCKVMTSLQKNEQDPGGWLARRVKGDDPAVLRAGMPKLCPKWSKVASQVLEGDYAYWYPNGTYVVVKTKPKPPPRSSDETGEISPGTYRVTGDVANCYWERATQEGKVIDSRFLTASKDVTVRIRDTDGQFRSENCGVWKPVG